jgi:glycosyltransferase involved in cell wall biosynthesis
LKPFSIIIPVYNEQDIIVQNAENLIAYLTRLYESFEIIIGSNGSMDNTPLFGKRLADQCPMVRFFHVGRRGVGYAFREGVRVARYDFIVSLDMDLSVELGFIEQALNLLDEGYEIVVGSKKMGHQRRSAFRILGSGLFILCSRLLLGLAFEDYSIAAKAYRKSVLLRHLDRIDHGTSYVIDMIALVNRDGGRIVEVPVRCEDFRTSKFNIVHEGIYRYANLFRLWWALKRGCSFPPYS